MVWGDVNPQTIPCVYLYLFEHLLSILLSIYLGVELLGHMIILCLTSWGATKLFSRVAERFSIPPSYVREVHSPHPCQHLVLLLLCFDYSHPNGYEMVSHCGFDLYDTHHFMCLLTICISSLEKWAMSTEVFSQFLNWVVCYLCCSWVGILSFEPHSAAVPCCKSSTHSGFRSGVWAGRRESKKHRRGWTWGMAERVLILNFIFLNNLDYKIYLLW